MAGNIIKIEREKFKPLAKAFGVTTAYVSMSLAGKRNGEVAKKIRHTALTQFDGQEYEPVKKQ